MKSMAVAEYGNASNGSKHTSNLLSPTWFSLNDGQKTWEGRVDPPRAVTPQGELDPLVQLGRELETEGLSLSEQVRAGTLEGSSRAQRLRRLRILGESLFPRRDFLIKPGRGRLVVWNLDSTPQSCGSDQDAPFPRP